MGPNKLTIIRPAQFEDMPHLLELGRFEHRESGSEYAYSMATCERMLQMVLLDTQAICIVITYDNKPHGYIIGGLDHIDMNIKPMAIAHKWYVHNPESIPQLENGGAKLLKAFEHWAINLGATDTMITLHTGGNSVKYYEYAFNQMGYDQNRVYYKKRLLDV